MAFKASNEIPSRAYQSVKQWALKVKNQCSGYISQSSAGNVNYDFIRTVRLSLQEARDILNARASTPGLAQFAKDQENDQAYDVVAEFTALISVIDDGIAWLDANVPTNVTASAPSSWTDNQTMISNTFTPAQTAGLRAELTAIVNQVE